MPSFFVCQGISTASQTLLHVRHMNFNELILMQCVRQGSVNISALQRHLICKGSETSAAENPES